MDNSKVSGLSVFANGVFPVELSDGKRLNAGRRVPVQASVDVSTGEVRFYVDPEAVKILSDDNDGG